MFKKSLLFLSSPLELAELPLLSKRSANDITTDTICDYYSIYVEANLRRLFSVESLLVVNQFIMRAKESTVQDFKLELEKKYSKSLNYQIKAIYCTLQRLIKGELDPCEPLMHSLIKIDSTRSVSVYNEKISKIMFESIHSFILNQGMKSDEEAFDEQQDTSFSNHRSG